LEHREGERIDQDARQHAVPSSPLPRWNCPTRKPGVVDPPGFFFLEHRERERNARQHAVPSSPAPFWETNIVIAAEDTSPRANVPNDEDISGPKSAKMGKDEGTQSGGADQSPPPETKTQKVEQPSQQKPTTGD
jgi:hypothetical protein